MRRRLRRAGIGQQGSGQYGHGFACPDADKEGQGGECQAERHDRGLAPASREADQGPKAVPHGGQGGGKAEIPEPRPRIVLGVQRVVGQRRKGAAPVQPQFPLVRVLDRFDAEEQAGAGQRQSVRAG